MIALLSRVSRSAWEVGYAGNVERLRQLLTEKPERARATGDGETLLMWLPPGDESTAMDVAELLLDHGADPTVRDPHGLTAADRAERNAMFKVAAMLRAREGETRPLTADLYSRHENCVLGSPLPCSRRRRFGAGATATDQRSARPGLRRRPGADRARVPGQRAVDPADAVGRDRVRLRRRRPADRVFVDVTRPRQTETEGSRSR